MKSTQFKKGAPRPPGAGRKKGTPNKSTAYLREIAQQHTDDVIAVLASIAQSADSDSARVAASRELLDRGYGKSLAGHEISAPGGKPLAPPTIVIAPVGAHQR